MIRLCTEKEVRDMKKYVKLFFTLMVCFTLSFSLYSVVSAQEKPTVTDDSETVVEEIPGDPTLTDEPEETDRNHNIRENRTFYRRDNCAF